MPTSRYSFVHFLRSDLPLNHPYFLPKTGINWTITLPIKSFILFKISALNVYVINKFWKHSQIITVKLQHPIYVACNMQIEDHTIGGPPGGYWILISHEKISPIPKSRKKISIFLIPNFPPPHPAEYLVLEWEPSSKQWQLCRSLGKLYNDNMGPQGGVGSQFPVKNRICFYQISPELFYCGWISSRSPQSKNPSSRYPVQKIGESRVPKKNSC